MQKIAKNLIGIAVAFLCAAICLSSCSKQDAPKTTNAKASATETVKEAAVVEEKAPVVEEAVAEPEPLEKALQPNPSTDFKYTLAEDGKGVRIQKYIGSSDTVIIPSIIEDLPVTEIDDEFCSKEHKLRTVWYEILGKYIDIYDDITIKTIVYPETATKIGTMELYNALESVTLPKNLQGPDDAGYDGYPTFKFTKCSALKEVILPEDTVFTRFGSFEDCTSLTSITIPASITEISDYAFNGCSSLSEIIIPDSVSSYKFWYAVAVPEPNTFKGTNLTLKTQAKLKALGYTGSF